MSVDFAPGPVEASLRAKAIAARQRLFSGSKVARAAVEAPPVKEYPYVPARVLPRQTGYGIIAEVAKKYGLLPSQLTGPSRARSVTPARHEAMFRIVMELDYSYPKAGRCMGGRDHSTAINSVKAYAARTENAAEVLQAHYRREANKNDRYRTRCLEMHKDGMALNDIAKRSRISVGALSVWIDEAAA